MGDYQPFRTRCEAMAEIEKMRGWYAYPQQLYLPDDPNANRQGNTWVVATRTGKGDPLYLRRDGYIR